MIIITIIKNITLTKRSTTRTAAATATATVVTTITTTTVTDYHTLCLYQLLNHM